MRPLIAIAPSERDRRPARNRAQIGAPRLRGEGRVSELGGGLFGFGVFLVLEEFFLVDVASRQARDGVLRRPQPDAEQGLNRLAGAARGNTVHVRSNES